MFHAAQLLRNIDKVPGAAIEGAHDVELAIVIVVSPIGIEHEIHVGIFGKAEFFNIAVPVLDADKEFFHVATSRIGAEGIVGDIKAQNAVVHKRPHLGSDIDAVIAGAELRGDQFPALRHSDAGKEKRMLREYCE